jgi:hypothetical protein
MGSRHPNKPTLELAHGRFQLIEKTGNGKTRAYYRCRYIPETGPYRGKQCEFCARNDSSIFSLTTEGRHIHKWSIGLFTGSDNVAPVRHDLLSAFSQFVCNANISLRQATKEYTRQFCNSLIEYGFRLGQASAPRALDATELFPKLSIRQLRAGILHDDGIGLTAAIVQFRSYFVHLSLDAASFHGNKILDFVLLQSDPRTRCIDYFLFDSQEISHGTQEFYATTTAEVITRLKENDIRIVSIVGDGLSSQIGALSPTAPSSIQNSDLYLSRFPYIRNILYIYCSCHLLNLALHDALDRSVFLRNCERYVNSLARILRKSENRQMIGRRCPTYSPTRWCHAYLLVCFFARHRQVILAQGISIPHEIFGYGALLEPLFVLMGKFENRRGRFYMRERQLAKFHARMRQLATKYQHETYFPICCQLLSNCVFLRFAAENHDLSLVAHALTARSKFGSLDALEPSQKEALFLDGVYEEIRNEEAVARAVVASSSELPESEEEEEEETSEPIQPLEGIVLDFNGDFMESQLRSSRHEVEEIQRLDAERGTYMIGANLIRDYGERSEWDSDKILECQDQFAIWLSTGLLDSSLQNAEHLKPPLFWTAIGTSSRWTQLKEFAEVVMSLPASETENERVFSVRKYVIGDRGAKSKNDLVTARVRTRLEERKHSG